MCSSPGPQASLVEAEANYRSASLRYQQLKPMAAELWVDFLHRRTLEPHHSDQHLKAVANILRNERRRESYQTVRRLKGVAPMTSVSQVETPSPTGPILHTSQAAVEQQIGSAFSRPFQGANGTPFLSPLCSIVLVWMAPQLQPATFWQAPLSAPRKWMNSLSSLSLPSANPQTSPSHTPVYLSL